MLDIDKGVGVVNYIRLDNFLVINITKAHKSIKVIYNMKIETRTWKKTNNKKRR